MDKDLSREAMNYLVDLGKETREVRTFEIGGHMYVNDSSIKRIDPVDPPVLDRLSVYSLTGLVDFFKADVDKLFEIHPRYTCVVESPVMVKVYTPITGYQNKRQCVVTCEVSIPQIRFDTFMSSEDFMVMLMTRFEESDNRELVLRLVGNMTDEQSNHVADDGSTQKVTVKAGIAKMDDVAVKNPVYLSPKRTYHEVEQPASPFILRFKEGPQAALYEADGGAWKNEAVQNVGLWLRDMLADLPVEVIA